MRMLILIIVLVLVLGGGGGYYGHSRWGYGGGAGIGLGTILLIFLWRTCWGCSTKAKSAYTTGPWFLQRLIYYPACNSFWLTASPSPLFNSWKTIVESRVIPPSTKNARWMPRMNCVGFDR